MTSHDSSAALSRRSLLAVGGIATVGLATTALSAAPAWASAAGPLGTRSGRSSERMARRLGELERDASVTIGVTAVTHGDRRAFRYRGDTRFPMCSLFKVLAAAALVQSRGYDEAYWSTPIPFTDADLVVDSNVLDKLDPQQATPGLLADAALRYSDNTAGNLMLRELGGPAAITAFATSLGATRTRLDRWEPDLNAAVPGDERDTTTPDDIATMYSALLLDDAAGVLTSARLREWMLRNTTSGARMRAGLTPPYELADKTGGGEFGVVNDAGVLWRPGRPPMTLAILTRTDRPDAVRNNEVVAEATRIVVG
ncbi:class A beta-lactamase [Agromyces endophyticus]|uniref:class A beta-lactamase n=1 Tax=Agromyces sp. H17E-10 TaxID=2932244 RepID=UPI001FD56CC1|nr:class A beta-lactamase [Agromyces sp. H17E-10]UOQ89356.1 class A beta-lactamase [Agromyces sp. H17E-10]